MNIGEVCLLTNDVRRLADFYKKLLGIDNNSDDDTHQFIISEGDDFELFKTADWWEKLLKDECGNKCSIEVKEADCYDVAWREWFGSGHEYGIRDKEFLDKGLYDILNFLLIYVRKYDMKNVSLKDTGMARRWSAKRKTI